MISLSDLERGAAEFEKREGRDSMYRVATFLLEQWWGKFPEMADALTVLLLTWNQAYYRYGRFELKSLESCLVRHWPAIEAYRARQITSFCADDYKGVKTLFNDMLHALANSKGVSPVSVAKALHLLAPSFFPIWDMTIAKVYGCNYSRNPCQAYIAFCEKNKEIVQSFESVADRATKTLLKRIDEYNYVRFSKGWI